MAVKWVVLALLVSGCTWRPQEPVATSCPDGRAGTMSVLVSWAENASVGEQQRPLMENATAILRWDDGRDPLRAQLVQPGCLLFLQVPDAAVIVVAEAPIASNQCIWQSPSVAMDRPLPVVVELKLDHRSCV